MYDNSLTWTYISCLTVDLKYFTAEIYIEIDHGLCLHVRNHWCMTHIFNILFSFIQYLTWFCLLCRNFEKPTNIAIGPRFYYHYYYNKIWLKDLFIYRRYGSCCIYLEWISVHILVLCRLFWSKITMIIFAWRYSYRPMWSTLL